MVLQIGVAIREPGNEPKIESHFGLPRPFAEISLSDRMTEIRTETDNDLAELLTSEFDNKPNTAAREAIRLYVITVAGDQFKIKRPEGHSGLSHRFRSKVLMIQLPVTYWKSSETESPENVRFYSAGSTYYTNNMIIL